MEKRGRKNSGRPKDFKVLEQLEEFALFNDYGPTVTISTANLKWLVYRAGLWVRKGDRQ